MARSEQSERNSERSKCALRKRASAATVAGLGNYVALVVPCTTEPHCPKQKKT
ncbi:MAG: hypothetical protein RSB59_06565 [Clostridia bacterium]